MAFLKAPSHAILTVVPTYPIPFPELPAVYFKLISRTMRFKHLNLVRTLSVWGPLELFSRGVSSAATARSRQFPTRQQGLNVTNNYRRKLDIGLRDGPLRKEGGRWGKGSLRGQPLLPHSRVGAWIFMWMLNQTTFCLSDSHMERKNHEARIWIFLLLHTN